MDKKKKQSTGSLEGNEEETNNFDDGPTLANLIAPEDGLATIVAKQVSPIGKEKTKLGKTESAGDSTEYQIEKDGLAPKS